jgi:hypothetical protein
MWQRTFLRGRAGCLPSSCTSYCTTLRRGRLCGTIACSFEHASKPGPNGPVVPAVYKLHRGHYSVKLWPSGDPKVLDKDATDTINAVIEFYCTKSSTWLSSLTHREDPWKNARGDLLPGQIGNREITTAAMAEYYHSLVQ